MLAAPTVDELSDEETVDDNVQLLRDAAPDAMPDLAGELEVLCDYDDDNINASAVVAPQPSTSGESQPAVTVGRKRKAARGGKTTKAKKSQNTWTKQEPSYSKQPVDLSNEKIQALYEQIGLCFVVFLFLFFVCC